MSRFDNQDWGKSADEGEKASDTILIHKRLKKDHDKVYVAFLENAEYGRIKYEGDSKSKGQCNVAVFKDGGGELDYKDDKILVMLLELAPKHMTRFSNKLDKPRNRGPKVWEIERFGPPNDTQVAYELEYIRDLTAEEIAVLETVPLHPRFAGDNEIADGSPPPSTPVINQELTDWNAKVKLQMGRLGWTGEQVKSAIKHFCGDALTGSEMTAVQRNGFLGTLGALPHGSEPTACQPVDLEEDSVDFY